MGSKGIDLPERRSYYSDALVQNSKETTSPPGITGLLAVLAGLFITLLIVSNIIAVKIVVFDLKLPGMLSGQHYLPAAIVVFPITYILGDVLTEVYGFRYARRVILLGFFFNALAVLVFLLGGVLPAAPFWEGQEAYDAILGYTPRLVSASFIAYLVGEFSNSIILSRLKLATKGRWLWSRTIGSTIVGQFVDSVLFITIAFAGVMVGSELVRLVITQWVVKVLYEVIATPLTYLVVSYVKRREMLDVYDPYVSGRPWKFSRS